MVLSAIAGLINNGQPLPKALASPSAASLGPFRPAGVFMPRKSPLSPQLMSSVFLFTFFLTSAVAFAASTENTLYQFGGEKDGDHPQSVLIFDSAGNLYGTTEKGGNGDGTVFKLSHNADGT